MPKFFDQAQPDAQPPLEPVQPLERYAWTQPETTLIASPGPSEAVDVDNALGPAAQAHNPGIRIHDPAERAPSPPITSPRKYGRAILSAALGVVLAAGLGVGLLRSPGPDSSTSLRDRTTTEAPPAPTPNTVGTVAPTTTEQPAASTSTLPRPTTTAPITTKPSTPNAPTTIVAPEKASEKSLTDADLTALHASGYEGITTGHKLEVIKRLDDAVLVSVDGAHPSEEHIKNLQAEITAVKMIAASKPSFTTRLKFGPSTEMDITYNMGPAAAIDTHYFVFSNGNITELALPLDTSAFPNEYTRANPRNRTSVTVVKMQAPGTNVEGIDAQSHFTGIGAFQAYAAEETDQASEDKVAKALKAGVDDMSYLTNSGMPYDPLTIIKLLGTELGNNTGDDMYAYARAGKAPYTLISRANYVTATRFVGAKQLQGIYAKFGAQFPAGSIMTADLFATIQNAP